MSIIEQIKALPINDFIHVEVCNNGHVEDEEISIPQLIALAESHERLLGDARRALLSLEHFKDMTATDPRVERRYEALKVAIAEAEKL